LPRARSTPRVGEVFSCLALAALSTACSGAERVCEPGGGTVWIEEGSPLRAPVGCRAPNAPASTALVVDGLPSGASFDASSSSVAWTPGLDQAGVYELAVRAPSSGESGVLKIGVLDRFDASANVKIRDPRRYTEELGLPVMHLDVPASIDAALTGGGAGDDQPYVPATVTYRGHVYTAEAKYRGHSSLAYPKKNYTLRFSKADEFNEPALGGGFLAKRKVCLVTTFDDVSQVRYRLAFELWNRMDGANIQVRHFSVVLYVNGAYFGLYTLADKLDGNLFQAQGMSEQGNLFMGIDHDANFAKFAYNEGNPQDQSRTKGALSVGWEKKEGVPAAGTPGALDDITSLVSFIASSSDADFAAQAPERLNLRDHYNWFIFATAIQAFDTLGKNALHYHDPVANQPWRVVLWDFNESFGQTWQTKRFPQSLAPVDIAYVAKGGVGYTNRNWLWRRLLASPTFKSELEKRYGALLRNELEVEKVVAILDAMVSEVAPSALRDARKWQRAQEAYFGPLRSNDFLDAAGEAAYVRSFIRARWADLLTRY
jgi:hypothetical protein